MRILHLTKKFPDLAGGDASVVYNLKQQQSRMGHEVFILTSSCREVKNETGIYKYGLRDTPSNLDRITLRRLVSLVILSMEAFAYLARIKPDIIHSHSADLGFFVSFPARLYRVGSLNTCHGVSFADKRINPFKRAAEKLFLRYGGFRRIAAVDNHGLHVLRKAGIKNSVYVPNGIDLNKFNKKSREKNKIFKFLFVGRLEEQKGLEYLLKAAMLIKTTQNFQVDIVGTGSMAGKLAKTVRESGLNRIVDLSGKLKEEELLDRYARSDAFVLPSVWEGTPLVLLEAMASGLPVIATDAGGVTTICSDGETALIVKPGDPVAFALAMEEIMRNEKLREKLKDNGRELATRFTWENTAKEYGKVYSEILERN